MYMYFVNSYINIKLNTYVKMILNKEYNK